LYFQNLPRSHAQGIFSRKHHQTYLLSIAEALVASSLLNESLVYLLQAPALSVEKVLLKYKLRKMLCLRLFLQMFQQILHGVHLVTNENLIQIVNGKVVILLAVSSNENVSNVVSLD